MAQDVGNPEVEVVDTEAQQAAAFGLSDDDFLSMSEESFMSGEPTPEEASDTEESTSEETSDEDQSHNEPETDPSTDSALVADDDGDDGEDDVSDTDPGTADLSGDDDGEESEEVDYEGQLSKVLGTFKAAGRDVKVNNVDEAVSLMQQGFDYSRKMQSLKPHLKTVKILETNKIDAATLNHLIDLSKKDPAAISKLIQDSGIDPLDMDENSGKDYKPTEYDVPGIDQAVNLDQALNDIEQTPTYNRTIDIVGNQWDQSSQQELTAEPEVIKTINDHVASGIYDVIADEVARQKALNQLGNISDLAAYKQVGDSLHAKGGFNHLFTDQQSQNDQRQAQPQAKRIPPKQQVKDQTLNNKRKAASPAKQSAQKKLPVDFNPLSLSDAEFEKFNASL